MGGKKSRTKGATFERYLVNVFRPVFPGVFRGRQSHTARECDVEGTPLRIEAKHYAGWPDVYEALKQAGDDGKRYEDTRPCAAITKKDRTQPTVTMFLIDFLKFCEENLYGPDDEADVVSIQERGPYAE